MTVGSSPAIDGLTSDDAALRLVRDGRNVLPLPEPPAAWRRLVAQLTHFFALLLWAASAMAFVAGMPQLGVAIIVVVLVNGVFAYAQERRAERAAQRLQELLPRRATVRRDGQAIEIDAAELVLGDIVLLVAGDRVSADLELLSVDNLAVDTSMLTGESVPSRFEPPAVVQAGMFVVDGEATSRVVATGGNTRLAGIAELSRAESRPKTPLARELDRVVRVVAAIAIGVGVAFFVISLLVGSSASDGFLFGVGVTVALVPEGLLPTVTLSLAIGAQRMARRHALVRRLESVETLGSTTFICTDKTGTLTRNEMAVVEAWTPAGSVRIDGEGYAPTGEVTGSVESIEAARDLAEAAHRCSHGAVVLRDGHWQPQGDPMEAALAAFAARIGDRRTDTVVLTEHAFDAHRRRMSVVVAAPDGATVVVKGAPEAVLPLCGDVGRASAELDRLTTSGLRVLAVGTRHIDRARAFDDVLGIEQGLRLLGLVALEDPPRPGTREAVTRCRDAGIRLAMLTGDHPATAAAIADDVGLRTADGLVLDGADLPADDEVLGALVDRDGVVVSRITPEGKLRVAQVLRRRGHVVAMTGDGVNDGPALHAADIGVAMGTGGTDVAREAADLVLLDDEFRTIVAAVEQGRSTFANLKRFLTYHLTDNVAELTPFVVWALSGGHFPLAIGVLQVLCLDIGTDLLPALALGAEPSHHESHRPVAGRHLFDRVVRRRAFALLGPAEATMAMVAFLATMLSVGWRPGDAFPTGTHLESASGAAFSAIVIGQMANAFACRSTVLRPGQMGWFTNPMLVVAVATELVLLVGFLYVGPIADVLDHRGPSAVGWAVALAAAPAVLAVDALDKAHRRRRMLMVTDGGGPSRTSP